MDDPQSMRRLRWLAADYGYRLSRKTQKYRDEPKSGFSVFPASAFRARPGWKANPKFLRKLPSKCRIDESDQWIATFPEHTLLAAHWVQELLSKSTDYRFASHGYKNPHPEVEER